MLLAQVEQRPSDDNEEPKLDNKNAGVITASASKAMGEVHASSVQRNWSVGVSYMASAHAPSGHGVGVGWLHIFLIMMELRGATRGDEIW